MSDDTERFRAKLLETFRIEALEHLDAISSGLLSLEQAREGDGHPALERVFREAHTMKGAARAVNLQSIEQACHAIESTFASLKSNRASVTPQLLDAVHTSVEAIRRMIAPPESAPAPAAESVNPVSTEPARTTATVRLPAQRLEAIMKKSEELVGPRLAAAERSNELLRLHTPIGAWRARFDSLRASRYALERMPASAEVSEILHYLEAEDELLRDADARLSAMRRAADADTRALTAIVDSLLDEVREAQMLPFSTAIDSLPRLARDLARTQEKQVDLRIQGQEIEVDRRVLDELKGPLQHLLRNCVDHGIERPEIRRACGKSPEGGIRLNIAHRGNHLEVVVADDGAGIDTNGVRETATRLGLLSQEDASRLGDAESLSLIFHSGLSTSPAVTEISGRGLGLPIVREKIEQLGGRVTVDSRRGAGTTIRMDVPLTLASVRGILIESGGGRFVLPSNGVERVMRVNISDIRSVEGIETLTVDGRTVRFVYLTDTLGLPRPSFEAGSLIHALVLGSDLQRTAFGVAQIIDEREIVVKGLGPQLVRLRNVVGATVLGTGEIIPVLNTSDLLKSVARSLALLPEAEESRPRASSILVVEDSITSRTLLKNILESAGYDVTVAGDGVDGWTALKEGSFDLVVSDVEMPRMNGFELTERISADASLSDIPVVLVTALDSPEYRERGMDAGARAYIVKSNFDQSNLLDVVRRLI